MTALLPILKKLKTETVTLPTEKGAVHLAAPCQADLLQALTVDHGIGVFGHYAPSAAALQKQALVKVARMEGGKVVAAYTDEKRVVGYIAFHPPDPRTRFGQLTSEGVVELGGIEVARGWRGLGIAKRMLELAFAGGGFEDKIVFASGYRWCWDLQGTDMEVGRYRRMMQSLFERHGFRAFVTDEPNIAEDPLNLFVVRVGRRVSKARLRSFQALLVIGTPGAGSGRLRAGGRSC